MFGRRVVLLYGLLLTTALTSAVIRDQGWWKHTVFYQIYPRSFMDSNGDGTGDLRGITRQLKHFVNSSVGAIWLSPINKSPMVDFGYDISDFKDIDEIFGSMADFENLLARAKELGIKVILDLVPNHTSDQHNWFVQSARRQGKYADYYIWRRGRQNNAKPPNNWLSVFGGPAWTYNSTRDQWYFHQFHEKQPDLNYSNPEVQQEMKEIIEYWLAKGVDGFRVDAVPHLFEVNYEWDEPRSNLPGVPETDYNYLGHTLTKDQPQTYELVKSWRRILDNFANVHNTSEKVMMTEAYTTLENTTKYYDYGSHIPFNFNFIMNVNAASNATAFKTVIDDWMNAMPKDGVPNWVMGNHDRSRAASRFPGRADQMTMLAMILPGVAVTYYGEEIGMVDKTDISWNDTRDPQACKAGKERYKSRSRDPARTPFQWNWDINAGFSNATKTWLPVHANYPKINLLLQKHTSESHYVVYRALAALRNTSNALKIGSLTTDVMNGTILCVLRKSGDEAVTLLINFSSKNNQTVNLRQNLAEFNDNKIGIASVGSNLKQNQTVHLTQFTIPPSASVVITSFKVAGNAAREHAVSLATVLLSILFLLASYK